MRIVSILGSIVDSQLIGRIGSWFGDLKSSLVTGENTPIWQHYGFASRPKPADENGSCEGVIIGNGINEKVMATRDIRAINAVGDLEEGDSCLYAQTDKEAIATVMCKENGSIYVIAPTEVSSQGTPEKSHSVVLDVNANAVIIAHADGPKIAMTKDTIIFKNGVNSIVIGSGGITIVGNVSVMGSVACAGPMKGTPTII